MAKYHINSKGEPGLCRAEKACPFGGDDVHYTTKEGAQADVERILSERYGGEVRLGKFTTAELAEIKLRQGGVLTLSELNALAKTTTDPQVIEDAIEKGSDRTLAMLSQNDAITVEQQEKILDRTHNSSTRATIFLKRKDGDYSRMTPDDAEEMLYRTTKGRSFGYHFDKKTFPWLHSDVIDDEIYNEMANSGRISETIRKSLPSIMGNDNKISSKTVRDHLSLTNWRGYPLNVDRALVNGKLNRQDLMDAPDEFIHHFSATGPSPILGSKEVDTLGEVALARKDERLAMMVAKDSRTGSKTLSALADTVPEWVYGNSNTDAQTISTLVERHANEPFVRVGELKKKLSEDDFKKIIKDQRTVSLNRSHTYREITFQFDKALLKKYGLSTNDAYYLARADGYNAGHSWNEQEGTLKLRIDSGD